jgi:EAL domain-containing protein (putative c-di-GMP-specific phosphodiesterase class I)
MAHQHNDMPNRLIVEITETAAMRGVAEAARFASRVRALGARVALDDFGAGYTSFSQLKDFPIDMVKIDGRFTQKLTESHENAVLLRALLQLAKGFALQTVAECAETADDVAVLTQAGATYIQGHYYGRRVLQRTPGVAS